MSDHDATDERRFGLAAQELGTVLDAVDDPVSVHEPDGDLLELNRAAAELYGYSRSTPDPGGVGIPSSGTRPFTRAEIRERIERAAGGDPLEFEWQIQHSAGDVVHAEISLNPVTLDGHPHVVAVVRNVGDRSETRHRLETLIDNLPGMVYRCRNEEGWPMEFVGGQCRSLTGYDAATLESDDVNWEADVIHPEDEARVEERIRDVLDAEEAFEISYRIRTANGDERWVWERGRRVEASVSDAEMIEGFITDVTEQKEIERRLEAQLDGFEALNGVLRHDIRNDLQSVIAHTELIQDRSDEGSIAGYAGKVTDSAGHAVELTKTARDMAETMISTDDKLGPVRLGPTLERELSEIQSARTDAEIATETPIPAVSVRANDLLGSVFRNVLRNAVRHNDSDPVRVTVSVSERKESIRVRIADNGPGIPDDRKGQVFGKGEAGLDSSGTGLGLYLVRSLVERYGGEVGVEDNTPCGSVFVIRLPKAKEED